MISRWFSFLAYFNQPVWITDLIQAAALLFYALIAVWFLFLGRPHGLADNGDFPRYMNQAGLYFQGDTLGDQWRVWENSFNFVQFHYDFDEPDPNANYFSTYTAAIGFAATLCKTFYSTEVFPIFLMGGVLLTLSLLAFASLFLVTRSWSWPARLTLTALLMFIYTDAGHLLYFNSFYAEPFIQIMMVFLMAAGLFFYQAQWHWAASLGAFFLTIAVAALLVATKTQTIMWAPFFALTPLGLLATSRSWKTIGVSIGYCVLAIGLLGSTSWYVYTHNPTNKVNLINHLFKYILPQADNPERVLWIAGIDPSMTEASGKHFWSIVSDIERERVQRMEAEINFPGILAYYALHPDKLWRLYEDGARGGVRLESRDYGNFLEGDGKARGTTNALRHYSQIRSMLFPSTPVSFTVMCLIIPGLLIANLAFGALKPASFMALILFTGGIALFWASILIEANYDIVRHLYPVNAAIDLTWPLMAAIGVQFAVEWRSARQESKKVEKEIGENDGP